MASTYSELKIELIGTGEQTGTWGATTNDNFSIALNEAITGSATVSFSGLDITLTLLDTNAAQTARNLRLNLTGTSSGARQLILGSGCQIEKLYLVNNNLADPVTIKNTTGTGIAVPAGKTMFVYNTGADVVDAVTHLSSLTLGTALPITSGGTGSTSTTYVNLASNVTGTLPIANGGTGATTLTANNVLLGNGTSALQSVAPGTSGNVLTSNGTTWTSAAVVAALTGTTDSASPFETSLGHQAGNVTTGADNTFIGYQAGLLNTTGAFNTAVGSKSLDANTTCQSNIAVGYLSLSANTTGGNNVAVGSNAMQSNTTSGNNVAVGVSALNVSTGADNVAVGTGALLGLTTGASNTAVGDFAGSSLTTGSNNTIFGDGAQASSATVSNTVTLGNSSIATLRCQVTTITSLSDGRDKTDIKELNAGLGFVNELNPIFFTWNMRDGGKVGVLDTGFIAQELQEVQAKTGITIPGLVDAENPDKLEAGYGKLLPVLVKAIQELSAKVDTQAAEIAALKAQ
jgi:hypothetical protein